MCKKKKKTFKYISFSCGHKRHFNESSRGRQSAITIKIIDFRSLLSKCIFVKNEECGLEFDKNEEANIGSALQ